MTILIAFGAEAAVARVPFAVAGRSRALMRPIAALDLEHVLPVHRSVTEALNRLPLSAHPADSDTRGNF